MSHRIRPSEPRDDGAIGVVLEGAFPTPEEALIVEKLRAARRLRVSLVAESALFALDNEYGADESFMALELEPGALPPGGGLVLFAPELRPRGSGP